MPFCTFSDCLSISRHEGVVNDKRLDIPEGEVKCIVRKRMFIRMNNLDKTLE